MLNKQKTECKSQDYVIRKVKKPMSIEQKTTKVKE